MSKAEGAKTGIVFRHPGTIRNQISRLHARKLLVEQALKDADPEGEAYSKLLSESLWLHGVIAALHWTLGEGQIDNLFEDLFITIPEPPSEDDAGKTGSQVREADGPLQDRELP